MINRPFWRDRINDAWRRTPIVWLTGVRRSGKTTLVQSFGDDQVHYMNCDLPIVEDMVRDPALFFQDCRKPIIVFDEIHQLKDPSRLLKIGADQFPKLKILATGSSTLEATRKFQDTLTGRKETVYLLPVLWKELELFDQSSLQKRLLHGGLPAHLMDEKKNPSRYREWLDSFFARDIQKLFSFRDPDKFNQLFEYILKQSGGLFETSRAASELGVSRPTIESHLRALEVTHGVLILRPFHGGGQKELVKMPKVYGFDTGFVSFCRGWEPLRPDDMGLLWEHLVLESLLAQHPHEPIRYWRDTDGHEIDFIMTKNRESIDAIECKWNPRDFDPTALLVFRKSYPNGRNYVVGPSIQQSYSQKIKGLTITICDLKEVAVKNIN